VGWAWARNMPSLRAHNTTHNQQCMDLRLLQRRNWVDRLKWVWPRESTHIAHWSSTLWRGRSMCCVTGVCHQRSRLFISDVSKLLTVVLVSIPQFTLHTRNFREEWIYGKHHVTPYIHILELQWYCVLVYWYIAPDVSTICDTAKIILATWSWREG